MSNRKFCLLQYINIYILKIVSSGTVAGVTVGSHLSQDHFSQSLFQPKFICLRVYSRRKVTRFRLAPYIL